MREHQRAHAEALSISRFLIPCRTSPPRLTFFFSVSQIVVLRQLHAVANPWGALVPVRCSLNACAADGVEVVIEQTAPNGLPAGSSVVHTWCGVDGGRRLRCAMEVRCPGRAAATFHLHYQPAKQGAEAKGSQVKPKGAGAVADAKGGPRDEPPQAK